MRHELPSEQISLIFFEINKVLLDNNLSESRVDWMNFIRNPNQERDMLEHDDSFKEAYEELEKLSQDPNKVWVYEMAFKEIKDEEFKDTTSVAQAKGRAQGKAAGKAAAEIEFIEKMQAKGLTLEQIAHLLSMSSEQVTRALKK